MNRIRSLGSYRFFVLLILSLIFLPVAGQAAIPPTMNFQGYLTNPAGNPINGTVAMAFSIYAQKSGGAALWTESHPEVVMLSGVYSVLLGETTPIGLLFDAPYYLGIQVGAYPEMTPRLPLSSVGYAFRAGTAEQALIQGFPVSPVVPSANQVLRFNGTNWLPSVVNLDTDAAGILPLSLGGTGSDTQNFVDLSTSQTIGGTKTFNSPIGSSLPTGTAPLQINSTTLVPNLNAEMVGGKKIVDLDNRYGVAMAPSQASRTNTINTLDSAGRVGICTSIAIGADGFPVISYYDSDNEDLKVAKCGDASCTTASVTLRTLDSTGFVGWHTSIAIGADGFPVISYYDETNGDLKVAKCGDASCTPASATLRALDVTGRVGSYTAITVGSDGYPVISYYDATNQDLKVAKCGDASCTPASATLRTLDSTGMVGYDTSIAIGADGFPVISYHDNTNFDLKVAKCGDISCTPASVIVQTLDSVNWVGFHTSIAIGADGFPIISYNDATNGDLKVAKCGDALCTPASATLRTLDSAGGQYTSVAIGLDGFPIISYSGGGILKLAKCGDISCTPASATLRTLDSAGFVGEYTSITIGADGFPVISYYDNTNSALKMVKCANPSCLNNWWRR